MQPAIRYVRAADGVRIAYWALGEGTPLVVMPSTPFSHVQLEWDLPECRDWYQRLMAGRQLTHRAEPRNPAAAHGQRGSADLPVAFMPGHRRQMHIPPQAVPDWHAR